MIQCFPLEFQPTAFWYQLLKLAKKSSNNLLNTPP